MQRCEGCWDVKDAGMYRMPRCEGDAGVMQGINNAVKLNNITNTLI